MRTTLTLEDDLAARLKERARRRRISFKQAVNDAIRRGLMSPDRVGEPRPKFRVRTFASAFRPGVDPQRLNQLVDDLEARHFGGAGVIVPDVNLLIYAHNESAPDHTLARGWWESALGGETPVGIPWAVVFGFVRLATHPAVLRNPLPPLDVIERVDEWFACEVATPLEPGPRHLAIVRTLVAATGVAASLTTDTHLAALAIEHRAELHSNDRDFERFPGLRLHNPLL